MHVIVNVLNVLVLLITAQHVHPMLHCIKENVLQPVPHRWLLILVYVVLVVMIARLVIRYSLTVQAVSRIVVYLFSIITIVYQLVLNSIMRILSMGYAFFVQH